jgi:mRNA interferase MazF
VARRYIPDRNDIVSLDYEPTKGKEIGKFRPTLVLSSKEYNRRTGLLICCHISTSIRGAVTEVPVKNLPKPCVVAANLIHTLDWRVREVKKETEAEPDVMHEVLIRLIPLIGIDQAIERLIQEEQ